MKKLNKTQQKKVETAREAITKLQEVQATIYSNLSEDIGWDSDWLYDYMFNCTEDDSYSERVRSEIFE